MRERDAMLAALAALTLAAAEQAKLLRLASVSPVTDELIKIEAARWQRLADAGAEAMQQARAA